MGQRVKGILQPVKILDGRREGQYEILAACFLPSYGTKWDGAEKYVLKQEKDILKQEKDILKQKRTF